MVRLCRKARLLLHQLGPVQTGGRSLLAQGRGPEPVHAPHLRVCGHEQSPAQPCGVGRQRAIPGVQWPEEDVSSSGGGGEVEKAGTSSHSQKSSLAR